MKIPLDVSSLCVQSAAKTAYETSIMTAFKARDEDIFDIEEKIEALKLFLESADFLALRSAHPALAGGSALKALLETEEDGGVSLFLEGVRVAGPYSGEP